MERRYIKIVLAVVMAIVMGGCVYDFEPDSDQLQGLDKPLVVIEFDLVVKFCFGKIIPKHYFCILCIT